MYFIVTGSYPPDVCGIGDYTYRLAQEFNSQGIVVEVIKPTISSFLKILSHKILSRRSDTDKIIIQYPTAGYGKSLAPHLFSIVGMILGFKVIVTLHEFSSLSFKARASARIFLLFSNCLVYTNQSEINAAPKIWKDKVRLIPIASNIPEANQPIVKSFDIGYFGLIAPGKGVEDFISVCSSLDVSCKKYLMGRISPYFKEYADRVIEACYELDIEVFLDKSPDEAAELLAALKFTVLPFPEGLSLRRGSALAAMLNSSLVVSYRSSDPLNSFEEVAILCSNLDDMKKQVKTLLMEGEIGGYVWNAKKYSRELTWHNVAKKYIKI
jgi:glycosyltransferase involved in cell wall biosynthesis